MYVIIEFGINKINSEIDLILKYCLNIRIYSRLIYVLFCSVIFYFVVI